MNFIEKIRKGEIEQPTKPNFDIKDWELKWAQEIEKDDKNEGVYNAGKIIYEILSEIRTDLTCLNEKFPAAKNNELIEAYFAISNRDRFILASQSVQLIGKNSDAFSLLLNNNRMNNELTIDEIATSCVDGIEKAVLFRKRKQSNQQKQKKSADAAPDIELISKEIDLSQMYGAYEEYWRALLWGDYTFRVINKKDKVSCISQMKTQYEISCLTSQIRKARLITHTLPFIVQHHQKGYSPQDTFILINAEDKITLKSLSLSSADEQIKISNSIWRLQENMLLEEFPPDVLHDNQKQGFSILDASNVFRLLMLISEQFSLIYPKDDSINHFNDLLLFCPKIKKRKLLKSISKATGYNLNKVSKIMRFIEFDGSAKKDLWCHPIMSSNSASYIILTSALITPVIKRVVEHWIITLGMEIDGKGTVFEKQTLKNLNRALTKNKFINDFEQAISKRIKLKNGEEEIDLLCKVGNTILIGEAKSIVTTDSPISSYRTFSTLTEAASQANRKTQFVSNNLEQVFEKLNWEYDEKQNYSFVKLIINSNHMFVGHCINSVPICDERILQSYFNSNIAPLFSVRGAEHIAWLELYNDHESFQKYLNKFLNNPPQIIQSAKFFEHKNNIVPAIKEGSHKLIYERLVPKSISAEERLEIDYGFPLKTVNNIEEELKNIDFQI